MNLVDFGRITRYISPFLQSPEFKAFLEDAVYSTYFS